MSYAIESIAKSIGARRVGKHKATIDWLLTDSRSLSFPEETLFFALTTKRNSGARYIPDLYDRGVRNFVITEEDFKEVENGELRVESSMQHDGAQPTLNSQLSTLNFLIVPNPLKALQKLGKDVIVTVDDEISKVYKFLPGIESFVRFQNDERIAADLLVVIDASSLDRAGNVSQCVNAPKTLNIDHHISNTEYADYLYLDTAAAATGEIMYELIDTLGVEVDLEMATCIYTALYTDCGSFKYSNTMPKTMRIAAALLEIGVKPNEISDSMEIKPRSNIEMLTKVLETLTFDADGKIAYISINNEMYDKDVDTDTFISYPRYIEGVEVAIMFKAVEKAVTRVSMRSRNLDVSEIAITFGGGGHLRAAGCTIEAALPEAQQQLLKALKEKLV